ncbi:MAG: YIP1 family protein, partial [Solobacterium sp.]|nr:YIP1 family protein [Solobacterium sp.]
SEDVDLSSTQTIEEKLAEEARLEEERKQNEARLEKERLEELKKQEDERKEKQRLEEEKKKEETLQNKNEKNDDLDLSSIPSVVEKSKKVDRLSNTIQLKTADDTLILQRELDDELLEKRFNDGLLSRILNPYEIVERIDFYNLEKLWKPITKLIIKWAIIILPIILFLSNKLNAEAFSYARMLFTDKIWLWVRIVFLGVCTELLIYFGESLIERLCGKGGHFKKILTAESYVSPSIVVLYLIAGILLLVGFEKIGLIALIIAFVYSINLHTHVYTVVSGFNKNTAILITSIFYGILVALLLYFFRLSGEDMIQIMRVFFN